MKAIIEYGEMICAPLIAVIVLFFATSSLIWTLVLFAAGVVIWTLSEYLTHRFLLHGVMLKLHQPHHLRPREALDVILWPWAGFLALYIIGGGALLAGLLIAYTWHLFVHHVSHHGPVIGLRVPAALIEHHLGHHRFANRNFGDSTTFWDSLLGTKI